VRMSRRKTGQAQVRSKDQAADKLRDEVRIIENLQREGMGWPAIERIMGVNKAAYQTLKQQVDAMHE
jgi:anti-sigma regulatory factor (Ser/Thr protein kinase)